MIVGVPKEIKDRENRVAVTPGGVEEYVARGHTVVVERGAGLGSAFTDDEYIAAGAIIVESHAEVFARAEMICKVKEPVPAEYDLLRPDQLLFTYLHLAADEPLTRALMKNRVKSLAYETVQLANGSLPLLTPMSEVAGRMAVQVGAHYLERTHGGRGMLLGGVLIAGAKAPKLVSTAMIGSMRSGSVVVDVAIDQGGCIATARPTSHSEPTYLVDGVIHYCVTNMPGAVPRTSTLALSNVTLPYGLELADNGLEAAIADDPALAKGVNVLNGHVTYLAVAEAFGLAYTPLDAAL